MRETSSRLSSNSICSCKSVLVIRTLNCFALRGSIFTVQESLCIGCLYFYCTKTRKISSKGGREKEREREDPSSTHRTLDGSGRASLCRRVDSFVTFDRCAYTLEAKGRRLEIPLRLSSPRRLGESRGSLKPVVESSSAPLLSSRRD